MECVCVCVCGCAYTCMCVCVQAHICVYVAVCTFVCDIYVSKVHYTDGCVNCPYSTYVINYFIMSSCRYIASRCCVDGGTGLLGKRMKAMGKLLLLIYYPNFLLMHTVILQLHSTQSHDVSDSRNFAPVSCLYQNTIYCILQII